MGQFYNQPDFGTEAVAISPVDSFLVNNDLRSSCIYVGVAGDVAVVMQGVRGSNGIEPPTTANTVVFKNVPAGSILPVIIDFVASTGTTATNLVALK